MGQSRSSEGLPSSRHFVHKRPAHTDRGNAGQSPSHFILCGYPLGCICLKFQSNVLQYASFRQRLSATILVVVASFFSSEDLEEPGIFQPWNSEESWQLGHRRFGFLLISPLVKYRELFAFASELFETHLENEMTTRINGRHRKFLWYNIWTWPNKKSKRKRYLRLALKTS